MLNRLLDPTQDPTCGLVCRFPNWPDDVEHVLLGEGGSRPIQQRADYPLHRLLPLTQMACPPTAAHMREEHLNVMAKADRRSRGCCAGQNGPGVNSSILGLPQFRPLRP